MFALAIFFLPMPAFATRLGRVGWTDKGDGNVPLLSQETNSGLDKDKRPEKLISGLKLTV